MKDMGVKEEHIKSMRFDRQMREKEYSRDGLKLWNDFQNTGIRRYEAETGRYNAETGRGQLELGKDRFNAEKPFIGIENAPWITGPAYRRLNTSDKVLSQFKRWINLTGK